jgi:putative endonuclease
MIDIQYVKIFVSFMIKRTRTELALVGETLAATYLEKNNCSVLGRNYHSAYGEIDIIAMDNTELAFVEVKTRTSNTVRTAEESVTAAKQRKLTKTAFAFLQEHPQHSHISCRFDVISVLYSQKTDTFSVKHVKNAFLPADCSDSG